MVVYAIPGGETQGEHITLGFSNVTLVRDDGSYVTIGSAKRAQLNTPPLFEQVVAETVPSGRYTGIRFTVQSPEVRNAWQGDNAPEGLSLLHDTVDLPVSFSVQEQATTVLLAGFETNITTRAQNGTRVYLPVITLEVRERGEILNTSDGVQIASGTITESALFGMQWDGTMQRNLRPREQENEPTVGDPVGEEKDANESAHETFITASSSATTTIDGAPHPEEAEDSEDTPALNASST